MPLRVQYRCESARPELAPRLPLACTGFAAALARRLPAADLSADSTPPADLALVLTLTHANHRGLEAFVAWTDLRPGADPATGQSDIRGTAWIDRPEAMQNPDDLIPFFDRLLTHAGLPDLTD